MEDCGGVRGLGWSCLAESGQVRVAPRDRPEGPSPSRLQLAPLSRLCLHRGEEEHQLHVGLRQHGSDTLAAYPKSSFPAA